MKPAELEYVVGRCLTEGVPSGVVARIFELSPDLVRQAQSILRIERYGTDDLAEYTVQAQWEAVAQARNVFAHGSPTEKARFAASLLRGPISRSAKDVPDEVRRLQAEVTETMRSMREPGEAPAEAERSRFVATARET